MARKLGSVSINERLSEEFSKLLGRQTMGSRRWHIVVSDTFKMPSVNGCVVAYGVHCFRMEVR